MLAKVRFMNALPELKMLEALTNDCFNPPVQCCHGGGWLFHELSKPSVAFLGFIVSPLSLNLPIIIALPAPCTATSSLFELAASFLPITHHSVGWGG